MQWADLDSDDSDDESIVMVTQHAGLNDGTVQAQAIITEIQEQPESDDEEIEATPFSSDNESSDEEEEPTAEEMEAKQEELRKLKEEKRKTQEEEAIKKKPLTKKEKADLSKQ